MLIQHSGVRRHRQGSQSSIKTSNLAQVTGEAKNLG
jgi:predicted molibdopterin-dependent oxidoreductase YjgC